MKRDEIRLECLKLAQPCREAAEAVAKAKVYENYISEPEDETAKQPEPALRKNAGKPNVLS